MDQAGCQPDITPSAIITQHQSCTTEKGNSFIRDDIIANSSYSTDCLASAPLVEENYVENKTLCSLPSDSVIRDSSPAYPTLSEEQAREAILQFVAENCCYGKKPAAEMTIRTLENSSAFHYSLQTFVEERENKWKTVPYYGHSSNPNNGVEPSMWQISVPTPPDYKEGKYKREVPNTSSVQTCNSCLGSGYTSCYSCHGSGRRRCYSCGGSGRQQNRSCISCRGNGRQMCISCGSTGRKKCSTCSGQGKLRRYKQLKCQWKNHISDHVVERTELPDKLIRKVNGHVVFEEDLPKVLPISNYPDHDVNNASEELVKKHKIDYCEDRVLRQRHSVRVVPVAQVQYEWRDKSDYFFVYGYENKVYSPNYPQKYCCGCSIL